jgi:hypothetical protein
MELLTKKLVADALAPLIEHVQNNPGTITNLAGRLATLTGEKQYRQNVGEWLHPEPAKRIEPRFGMGLLLVRVYETELRNGADATVASAPATEQPKERQNNGQRKPADRSAHLAHLAHGSGRPGRISAAKCAVQSARSDALRGGGVRSARKAFDKFMMCSIVTARSAPVTRAGRKRKRNEPES